jgi:hypothetical protein
MPVYTTYALGESEISVSGGQELSGFTQGDGSHLVGETITLNSNSWEAVSIDESDDTSFDDSDSSQSLDGAQTFDGTSYAGGRRVEAEYELTLQDPDGNTYTVLGFNINEVGGSPSYGTVEGLAFVGGSGEFPPVGVPLTVISNGEGPSYAYDDLATPICFTRGTKILTPNGEVPVEDLAVGKEVLTLDQGSQPVRWIGKRKLIASDLQTNPKWRPVRICAGALGKGLPKTDLVVSPQHRVLVNSAIVHRMFNVQEVLVPAIKLVGLDGVNIVEDTRDVEYWHFLFDAHQVIWSNGAPTESLFPGPETLKAVSPSAHAEIMALFPELEKAQLHPATARLFPARGKKVKQFVGRHIKNNKPICELYH